MRHRLVTLVVLFVCFFQSGMSNAQERGTQTQPAPRPQRRTPAKPPTPLTLRQVIQSLLSLRNSSRVEDQISKAGGVQFQATPEVVDLLKQFGAGPKLISMIPAPDRPVVTPNSPSRKPAASLTVLCEPKDCAVAVDSKYAGATVQNRKTINDLPPGDVNVEVFADGYEHMTRRIRLEENQPKEEKFSLK